MEPIIGKPKLVALDLDGTILVDGGIPQRLKDALALAKREGAVIAVFTGRHFSIIPDCVLALEELDYVSTSNGALLLDAKTHEVLFTDSISKETALSVIDMFHGAQAAFSIYFRDGIVYDAKHMQIMDAHLKGEARKELANFEKLYKNVRTVLSVRGLVGLSDQPIEKIECLFQRPAARQSAYKLLCERNDVEVALTTDFMLEMTSKDVNKGLTLGILKSRLGFVRENVLSFGDSSNDTPMSAHSGMFVAMGNANDDVKERADFVTTNFDDDGVALIIENLFT